MIFFDNIVVYICDHRYQFFKHIEMYIAIRKNKTNMKILKRTRNGKPIIYNEKLIIMYLYVS